MLTLTKALKQRAVAMSLGVGGLMATICAVGGTTLPYAPRAAMAVLAGTFTAFATYSRQPGPSRDSFKAATFLTAGISLVCFATLLVMAVNDR